MVGFKEMKLLKTVVLVLLIVVLIPFMFHGASTFIPRYNSFVVSSGSMEPAIPTGSVIYTEQVSNYSTLSQGDVITFEDGDHFTTHRISDIHRDSGGYSFTTKGDANEDPDPEPITQDRVVGEVFLSIPYLGYLLNSLDTRAGLILLVIIPASIIILIELRNIAIKMKDSEKFSVL